MKTVISAAVALALVLSVVPAIAGDTFQTFSSMPTGDQELLTPLSDEQLATIEGEGWGDTDTCVFCANVASIYQQNLNFGGDYNRQSNVAKVDQEIN
jgi:hypothetical protein